MLTAGRNRTGLTERQIEYCQQVWSVLDGESVIALDRSGASHDASRTRFDEVRGLVVLGADVQSGTGVDANSRMSIVACLAHELAHAQRFNLGYRRPIELPDVLLDEAETSVRASLMLGLSLSEREDLVEDARDRLIQWLAYHRRARQHGES